MFGAAGVAAPDVDTFAWHRGDVSRTGCTCRSWIVIPLGARVAGGLFGILLGAPTLKLRGDYLAIVTLGFGEIIRVFMNNLDAPVNITNGPQGHQPDRPDPHLRRLDLGRPHRLSRLRDRRRYAVLLPVPGAGASSASSSATACSDSRIGRAWMAIREDEIAAKAMGINTRNMKLLAFGMGATFGGVSGAMFAAFQGFVSPESFSLTESIMIVAMVVLGGIGHLPGVILGARAAVGAAGGAALRRRAAAGHDRQGRWSMPNPAPAAIALAMIIIML